MTEPDLHAHAKRWARTIEATPAIVQSLGLTEGFLAIDATHGHYTVELWRDEKDGRWHVLTADPRNGGESSSDPCNYKGEDND